VTDRRQINKARDCASSAACWCGCKGAKDRTKRARRREGRALARQGVLETKAYLATADDTESALDDLIDGQFDDIVDAMRREWERQGLNPTDDELIDAIEAGALTDEMIDSIRSGYETAVATELVPSWEESLVAGAAVLGLAITAAAIAAWVSSRSDERVRYLTDTQVSSMTAVARTDDPDVAMMRRAASLTERQSIAMVALRDELLEDGAAPDAIERQLDEYQLRHTANRAATTGEADLVDGFANGGDLAIEESDLEVETIWSTRADAKVCSICAPLDGTVVLSVNDVPPAHPRCRCFTLFRIVES